MSSIRSPLIFVDADGEIAVFHSAEHVEACVTAVELLAREYQGYSSTGVRLHLDPIGVSNWRTGWVRVEAGIEQAADELRKLLIEFGVRHGAERRRLERLELSSLIASLRPGLA